MKLNFLLGSGVSIPAGLPTVEELTRAILSGDGIVKQKNSSDTPSPTPTDREREEARRRLIFLAWLKAQAACHYAEMPGRSVNYEDLAYLAGQIADDVFEEYENPAVKSFIRDACIDLGSLFRDMRITLARKKMAQLADTTLTYIRRTIVARLREAPPAGMTSYLQFFAKACRDKDVTEVNLFTLNHDTLVEDFLRSELRDDLITMTDGFRDAENGDGSRRWDYRVYDELQNGFKPVRIFKLHGSFNWGVVDAQFRPTEYQVSRENTDRNGHFIGTWSDEKPWRDGPVIAPLFLAGTFNKILKYNSGIFLELHHRFQRALEDEECTTLVVCGYGFGDKGVNTRIVEWRRRSVKRRLLIIDTAIESKIHDNARGSIQGEIEAILDPLAQTRLGPVKHLKAGIGKRPEDTETVLVTWNDVKGRLKGNDAEFLRRDNACRPDAWDDMN